MPRLLFLPVLLLGGTLVALAPSAGALPVVTEVSIDDSVADEGTGGGTTPFTFKVSLNAADLVNPVAVTYRTEDSAAKAPDDYTAQSGTLVFEPGETENQITIDVAADDIHEFNETFRVRLVSAENASIARQTGTGWIMNDDAVPALSIDDVSVLEGDDGTIHAVFTVTLDRQSSRVTSVWYETADGAATAGEDYEARSGWLVMPQMATSGTITVPVIGDTLVEDDETFFVRLASPFPATIAREEGTATIINDDAPEPEPPGPGKGKDNAPGRNK